MKIILVMVLGIGLSGCLQNVDDGWTLSMAVRDRSGETSRTTGLPNFTSYPVSVSYRTSYYVRPQGRRGTKQAEVRLINSRIEYHLQDEQVVEERNYEEESRGEPNWLEVIILGVRGILMFQESGCLPSSDEGGKWSDDGRWLEVFFWPELKKVKVDF